MCGAPPAHSLELTSYPRFEPETSLKPQNGGGLRIDDGNVQLTDCNIYSNEVDNVSTRPKPRARC